MRSPKGSWNLELGGRGVQHNSGMFSLTIGFPCWKVLVAWQHYNYLEANVAEGRRILRMNLDETSLCLFQGGGRGNVFISKAERRRVAQRVSHSRKRTFLTHVGIICDSPTVQPLLPQVIIGSERTFSDALLVALLEVCAPNVFLERGRTAWINARVMQTIMRRLAAALAPFRREFQPILLLDAHKCHVCARVLAAARDAGIWVVVVPARLTWLLQPLDTHAFALFKRCLRKAYVAERIRSRNGEVDLPTFLRCVQTALREVLQGRHWADSFASNGFGASQACVSERVRSELQLQTVVSAPSARPSVEQLQRVFPQGLRIPAAIWPRFPVPALRIGPRLRRLAPLRMPAHEHAAPATRSGAVYGVDID